MSTPTRQSIFRRMPVDQIEEIESESGVGALTKSLGKEHAGQDIAVIEAAMDRDKFLEADEAKAFGLIDEVFDKRPESGGDDPTHQRDITPS